MDLTYILRFNLMIISLISAFLTALIIFFWRSFVEFYDSNRNRSITSRKTTLNLKYLYWDDFIIVFLIVFSILQFVCVPLAAQQLHNQIGHEKHYKTVTYDFDRIIFRDADEYEISFIKDDQVILMLDKDLLNKEEDKLYRQLEIRHKKIFDKNKDFDVKLNGQISAKYKVLSKSQQEIVDSAKVRPLLRWIFDFYSESEDDISNLDWKFKFNNK